MSTERNELLRKLSNTICNASNYPERAVPYLLGGDMSKVLDETVDALIAAGYTKPRIITTVEELDALPVNSVVRDFKEFIYDKWDDEDTPGFPWWVTTGDSRQYASRVIALPATVLHEVGDA
jgi:hypothetical protein